MNSSAMNIFKTETVLQHILAGSACHFPEVSVVQEGAPQYRDSAELSPTDWGNLKCRSLGQNHLLTNSMSLTKSYNFAVILFIHHKNEDSIPHSVAVRSSKRLCIQRFVNSKAMCVFIIILNSRGQNITTLISNSQKQRAKTIFSD